MGPEATFLALLVECTIKECRKNPRYVNLVRAKMSVLRRKTRYSLVHTLAWFLVITDREPFHALGAFARRSQAAGYSPYGVFALVVSHAP
jgi:hypothetical protein